jgi:hypothetical protein
MAARASTDALRKACRKELEFNANFGYIVFLKNGNQLLILKGNYRTEKWIFTTVIISSQHDNLRSAFAPSILHEKEPATDLHSLVLLAWRSERCVRKFDFETNEISLNSAKYIGSNS